MTILHMDTEAVDDLGRIMRRSATEALDAVDEMRYSARALRDAWTGDQSDAFAGQLNTLIGKLEDQVSRLDGFARRSIQEAEQWQATDQVSQGYTSLFGDFSLSKSDVSGLAAGAYLATHLRWSSLRPNSMVFTGPDWMRKAVGIKEATRVIKPTTLVKQMAWIAYAENVGEAISTGRDTLLNSEYAGTERAIPAAVADGVVKFGILALGTTLLVGATAAITTISAPAVVIGGAVIATWAVGGFLIDKLAQTPAWEAWKSSDQRDQVIEWGTRASDKVQNFVEYNVKSGVEKVKDAFSNFIGALSPAPSPA
ncbi:MAG: hypothetical protein GYA17_10155 [Chloroflexi bacterium]|nr:WXG100 family type VII secretion target [Anaerolineaceae bacterium]NMB88713.1 hypothetical protein [Chloroflexota bacterium]